MTFGFYEIGVSFSAFSYSFISASALAVAIFSVSLTSFLMSLLPSDISFSKISSLLLSSLDSLRLSYRSALLLASLSCYKFNLADRAWCSFSITYQCSCTYFMITLSLAICTLRGLVLSSIVLSAPLSFPSDMLLNLILSF